ncbi:MAG: hypothetical protein AO394_09090 [Candidatus Fermentibacter daniensis]|nr:MAG: hypothetical protein AO394_09090 [Candidatus Fermentibacter daniensis]
MSEKPDILLLRFFSISIKTCTSFSESRVGAPSAPSPIASRKPFSYPWSSSGSGVMRLIEGFAPPLPPAGGTSISTARLRTSPYRMRAATFSSFSSRSIAAMGAVSPRLIPVPSTPIVGGR